MADAARSLYGVFGASGFTGRRVVAELVTVLPPGTAIVMAGRSQAKLQGVIAALTEEKGEAAVQGLLPVVADVSAPTSLAALCGMVKVLINCVGPFRQHGEPVVQAAIAGGCDYVDITGEPEFMEAMALKHHAAAVAAGVRIVHGCGMDSIPADVVSRHAARAFAARFGGLPTAVEHFWSVSGNGKGLAVHYGTWASLVQSMANTAQLAAVRASAKAAGAPRVQYRGRKQTRHTWPHYAGGAVGRWALPFPGADASVVRRTQAHLAEHGGAAGEAPLQYAVYFTVSDWYYVLAFAVFGALLSALASFSAGVQLLLANPELFSAGVFSHAGPSPEQMAATTFACTFRVAGYRNVSDAGVGASGAPDASLVMVMKGPEPGYVATSAMVVAAARALGEDGDVYPEASPATTGVLTPGVALNYPAVAQRLLARLAQRGITVFEVAE